MPGNFSPLFDEVFASVPQPLRRVLETALRLKHLRDLHADAKMRSQAPLSRSVLELLDVRVHVAPGEIERVPHSGPLVVVANHPFGIVDGLILDALFYDVRDDVKILTNSLIATVDGMAERCIPVDVFQSRTHMSNVRAVRQAREWLHDGHGLAIFPAGEVSHWRSEQRCISDPPWSGVAARLALSAKANVVPVYFVGANSLTFQIAGFVHPRMRTARLPGELFNKRGATIEVRIGNPISFEELERYGSIESATAYLRARTYMLGHRTMVCLQKRPEHTGQPRLRKRPAVIPAEETARVASEIEILEKRGCKILENPSYAVFAERGERMPVIVREIGKLRELTFRAVGEGTGRPLDLDEFDPYYTHLVLWHKQKACIAGAYRLAWTSEVLPARGVGGLYTSTLFRYAGGFFQAIGPAVELGRTFVRTEFQKDYAPLFLLWQAIARLVASRPNAPVLFGAVSISANYSDAAVELMVEYLRRRRLRADLARLVTPRHRFRSRLTGAAEIHALAACLEEIDELALPLAEMDESLQIPVLLRQYVRLNGRIAAFHVDRKFSNVIDALLVVNLRETSPKLLAKYMGAEYAAAFLKQVCGARSA